MFSKGKIQKDNQAVVGTLKPSSGSFLNRHRSYVFGGLLLIVIVAGVLWAYFRNSAIKTEIQVEQAKMQITDRYDEVNALIGQNKPEEATKVWEDYLKSNPPKDVQYKAYIQLGTSQLNARNYAKAEEAFNKARIALGKDNVTILSGLAYVYEYNGNKQAAIENYKKCIIIIKEDMQALDDGNKIQADQNLRSMEANIKRLGGTL